MIDRIQDWQFRNKLLAVTLLPLVVVTLLLVVAFLLGLQGVWQKAVPRQAALLQLESVAREYQGEVREYVLSGLPETLEEIAEAEEETSEVLEPLSDTGSAMALRVEETLRPRWQEMVVDGRALVDTVSRHPYPRSPEASATVDEQLERFELRETNLEDLVEAELALAKDELEGAILSFGRWVVACAAVGLALGLGLAYWLARWIRGPIEVLQEASERILDGNFRAGEKIRSREELGQLAAGFDRAALAIRELVAEKEQNLIDLKTNQAQLVRSGKLSAVGELAAGVAHEINNPLSAVLTYSVLLREKAAKSPPEALQHLPKLTERLHTIEAAARRCKDIADKLLTFSRQDEARMRPVDLATVVDDAFELMKLVLRRQGIHVQRQIDRDLPPIQANPSQLQQVIFNLVNNAVHVTPDGGTLQVTVRRREERCELIVADEGPGMSAAVLDRVFEPFYTTKPPGQGTGLGLAIVYGIVEAHGGEIEVDTAVGEGTRFIVSFPVLESENP